MPGTGGTPEVVVELESTEFAGYPELLPGGEWLLLTTSRSRNGWNDGTILAYSLLNGDRRVLVTGGTAGRYVPTGHLVYGRDETLFALPFDVDSIEMTPGPVSVIEGVRTISGTGVYHYGISDRGDLVYAPGSPGGIGRGASLVWMDRKGGIEPLPFAPEDFGNARLSPDESRIAVQIDDESSAQIWIYEVGRGASAPLATGDAFNASPVWLHDREWVYFVSDRGGNQDIWRKRADRSAEAVPVLEAEGRQYPWSISANEETLLFVQVDDDTGADIWTLSLDGDAEPEPLVTSATRDTAPSVSPDGRFVAFQSDEGGDTEVSVVEIATGKLWALSTNGRAGTGMVEGRWRDLLLPGGATVAFGRGNRRARILAVATTRALCDPAELRFPVGRKHGRPEVPGD